MKAELKYVIGLRVKRAREAAGLTQDKLAELVDRTKEAISNIERGVNYPAIETLLRIADAVGISMSYMLEEPRGTRAYNDMRAIVGLKLDKMSEKDLEFVSAILDILSSYKE